MYLHIPTYIHSHLRTYIPTYLHTYIPSYLHTFLPTYLPTYIPSYLHTFLPTYIPSYLHTFLPTYLPTFIPLYLRTYVPTYLHTYTITYIHTDSAIKHIHTATYTISLTCPLKYSLFTFCPTTIDICLQNILLQLTHIHTTFALHTNRGQLCKARRKTVNPHLSFAGFNSRDKYLPP